MKLLFIDRTGPMVRYGDGMIWINDLNPDVKTRWCMSRWEMLRFAWRSFVAAITP